MIVGNTVMYGAIAGECYFRGIAGRTLRRPATPAPSPLLKARVITAANI